MFAYSGARNAAIGWSWPDSIGRSTAQHYPHRPLRDIEHRGRSANCGGIPFGPCGHQAGTAIDDRRRSVKSCSIDRTQCCTRLAASVAGRFSFYRRRPRRGAAPSFSLTTRGRLFVLNSRSAFRRPFSDEKRRRHLHSEERLIEAVSAKPLELKSEQWLGANRARTSLLPCIRKTFVWDRILRPRKPIQNRAGHAANRMGTITANGARGAIAVAGHRSPLSTRPSVKKRLLLSWTAEQAGHCLRLKSFRQPVVYKLFDLLDISGCQP